jgi:hypothetical protein
MRIGKRQLSCGRDFGNSYSTKINLIENIRGKIGEQPEES